MSKKIALLLATMIVSMLLLAGCGGGDKKAAVFCKRKMHIIAAEDLTVPDLHFCC